MKLFASHAILTLLALSSCSDPNDELRDELGAARIAWESQGIDSYDVRENWSCCEQRAPSAWVTHVRLGHVENVTLVDMQDPEGVGVEELVERARARAATVEETFSLIEQWIGKADQITVLYDESLGYPTTVSIDPMRAMADDEFVRRMQDLEALHPGDRRLPKPPN